MTVTFVLDATNINSDIFGNKNVENAELHFYKIRRCLHYFQILSFGKYDIYRYVRNNQQCMGSADLIIRHRCPRKSFFIWGKVFFNTFSMLTMTFIITKWRHFYIFTSLYSTSQENLETRAVGPRWRSRYPLNKIQKRKIEMGEICHKRLRRHQNNWTLKMFLNF